MDSKALLKLLVFALFAFVLSFVSDVVSEPPKLAISEKYHNEYKELANDTLTQKEDEDLKRKEQLFFDELTNKENTAAVIEHIVSRKLFIVPVILVFWFFVGSKFGFAGNKDVLVSVVLIILLSSFNTNLIESLSYSLFFIIGNLLYLRKLKKTDNKSNSMGSE